VTTLNWLHISDWHQDRPNFDRAVVRDALIRDIHQRAGRISPDLARIDFVFFTGDLAYRGTAEQYQVAGAELLDPVLAAVGLGRDRLFVIPGNHDIDETAFEFLPPALQSPFPDETTAKTWLEEKRRFKRLFEPFEAFQNWQAVYQPRGFNVEGGACTVEIAGLNVGILGCNSAWMCRRHKEGNGTVNDFGFLAAGEKVVYERLNEIKGADLRIALIHHPFEWLQEFDRIKVQGRLERECDFILRGHEHSNRVQVMQGTGGSGVTIRAGACYAGRVPERPLYVNAYNFVSYNTETGKGAVYLRRWSDIRDEWVKDHDTYDDGVFRFTGSVVGKRAPAELILIPAGEFTMGSTEVEIEALLQSNSAYKREWFTWELPEHRVHLDAYSIYKTPVTVGQYHEFCRVTDRKMPPAPDFNPNWQEAEHPMVNVSWNDVQDYCAWAGVTLPTEAQWEKASRGTDGRQYPWGPEWNADLCVNQTNSVGSTQPVGSRPAGASPYGVLDMSGNVWEWCSDWYDENYYQTSPSRNPTGAETGTYRVLRGGSWDYSNPDYFRCANRSRNTPGSRNKYLGFRCVVRAE
jgi:formylglycine-generating enzyme required for sulfatase activity